MIMMITDFRIFPASSASSAPCWDYEYLNHHDQHVHHHHNHFHGATESVESVESVDSWRQVRGFRPNSFFSQIQYPYFTNQL